MVNFEGGTLVKGAYVVIDGKEYEVHMPKYSGNTPLSTENLNKMQTDIINNDIPTKIVTGEEVATNERLDGKQVYVKRFYWDSLEAGSTENPVFNEISLGFNLSDITVLRLEGFAISTSNNIFPLTSGISASDFYDALISVNNSANVIRIASYTSNFSKAYANLYYTKNDE